MKDFNAWSAENNIVWTAVYNGTNKWHVNSIKSLQRLPKKTKSLSNLLRVRNSNNVLNASFGFKRTKVAIIWLENVSSNSVTSVEASIWNVSVWSKQDCKCKEEERK